MCYLAEGSLHAESIRPTLERSLGEDFLVTDASRLGIVIVSQYMRRSCVVHVASTLLSNGPQDLSRVLQHVSSVVQSDTVWHCHAIVDLL